MKLLSRHFGSIDVDEQKIITFKNALPGFPALKRFIIINDLENPDNLFCWLQCVDDGMVSLVLMDIFKALPNYNPLVNSEELSTIGNFKTEDLLIYAVAVVPQDIANITINLKAPIIINPETQLGKQIIVTNDEYSIRHPIMKEIKTIK